MNALRLLFAALLLAGAGFVLATSAGLPERVASHFDGAGHPSGYLSRDGYRLFMLVFEIGLPLAVVAIVAWLPRRFAHPTNNPNRSYWLSPGQREQTLAYLARHALVLGCLLVVFASGVHWLVVMANGQVPPRLANAPLIAMLIAFLIALGVWIGMLYRRFRRVA